MEPQTFENGRGDEPVPVPAEAQALRLLQQCIGVLDVRTGHGDPNEYDMGDQHTVEQDRSVDQRHTVDDHGFRFIHPVLLVTNLGNQRSAQGRRGGLHDFAAGPAFLLDANSRLLVVSCSQ